MLITVFHFMRNNIGLSSFAILMNQRPTFILFVHPYYFGPLFL